MKICQKGAGWGERTMKHITKHDKAWIDGYLEGYESGKKWVLVEEREKVCELHGHTLSSCIYPDDYYLELFGKKKGTI